MNLKDWIRAARARLGLNQTDFGDRLGVVKQSVSHWEKGRNECSVTQFLKIASITKMNPADLDGWPDAFTVQMQAADVEHKGEQEMKSWIVSPDLLEMINATPIEARLRIEDVLRGALAMAAEPNSRPVLETTRLRA